MNCRILYLDRIKGFAILLVVFTHILQFVFKSGTSWPCVVFGSFHMQLFMFVSGFCAVTNARGMEFRNKICRRILQYFVTLYIGGWLLAIYCHFVLGASCNIGDCLWTSYAPLGNWYWYLKVLMLFVFLTVPLQLMKNPIFCVCYSCFLWLNFFCGWKLSSTLNSLLCLEHAASFFPFFLCGMFARIRSDIYNQVVTRLGGIIGGVMFAVMLFLPYEIMPHIIETICERFLRPTMAILAVVYCFKWSDGRFGRLLNGLSVVGRQSLDVYLYHYYFIFFLDLSFVWQWGGEMVEVAIYLCSFLCALGVSFCALWSGRFLSSNRLLRFLLYGKQ